MSRPGQARPTHGLVAAGDRGGGRTLGNRYSHPGRLPMSQQIAGLVDEIHEVLREESD